MKPAIFLRIASILTLLHFVGHTFGGVFGTPTPEQTAVLEVMKSHHFNLMGSSRSYWDFHFGYGLFVSVNLLVQCNLPGFGVDGGTTANAMRGEETKKNLGRRI